LNGSSIVHNLTNDTEKYNTEWYKKIISPITNNENITMGIDPDGNELTRDTKSVASYALVEMIEQKELIFSEIDYEAISQLERLVKQKTTSGRERFYIISKNGIGAETDDHIFASYITFAASLQSGVEITQVKTLGKPSGTKSGLKNI
jgi:hypothetical protein